MNFKSKIQTNFIEDLDMKMNKLILVQAKVVKQVTNTRSNIKN